MIKVFITLEKGRNILNLIKGIYNRTTINMILKSKLLYNFPPMSGIR